MYLPKHFHAENLAALHDVMHRFPFAAFVTHGLEGFQISHIPVLLDPSRGEKGTLIFHLARANAHWRAITPETEAVLMFLGPDAYISPSYYATKQETGKVVPTWNYIAVHAYGPVRVLDDTRAVRDIVTRLTREHEAQRPSPWAVSDAPPEYIELQLKGIVGLEMTIAKLEGKAKLSQNKARNDRDSVTANLSASTDQKEQAVATEMNAARNRSTGNT